MGLVKISELTAMTSPTGTEVRPVVQSGQTKKESVAVTTGEPRYDVKGYGASATAADRRSTLQAAVNAWGATGGELNHVGDWDISGGSITLPANPLPGSHGSFVFQGSKNATISTTSAHPVIADSVPVDVNAAVNRTNRKFAFRDLRFIGTGDAAQTLVKIIGSYGAEFNNCIFTSGGDGLDLIFALQPVIINCKANGNVGRSLRLRSANGIVTGANGANSGTNCAHVVSFRDYCSAGQPASIHLFEADGTIFDNLITEGLNPVRNVIFDANNNPTVKTLEIRGWHNENQPSSSGLVVSKLPGGVVRVARPFWQLAQTLIEDDGTSPAAALIALEDIPYIANTPFLKGGSMGWMFTGTTSGAHLRDSTYWVGGTVPGGVCQMGYDGSSGFDARAGVMGFRSSAAGPSMAFRFDHAQGFADFERAAIGTADGNPVNFALVDNGRTMFYLDQATNKLMCTVKYSTGTVKTGEVATLT